MDERFENLIHKRDLKLAWILLGLFCVMAITVSRLSYWVVGFASTQLMQHAAPVVTGILIAVACLISVWTTLGEGSLIRRTLFLACSAAVILAAWMLGLVASFYPESVRLSSREEVYVLGLLPTTFLALSLPLIFSRRIFGYVLAQQHGQAPQKEPITTSGLMMVTAFVGCCLGGVQLTSMSLGGGFILLAIISGCGFLTGLLLVLPAVSLLCSSQRNYLVWSLAINLVGSMLIAGAIVGVFILMEAWISARDMVSIFEGTLAATATFSVGIGIVRLFGYRTARQTKQTKGQA